MSERAFDVVVIAFGGGTNESPVSCLCRIVGIESSEAERLAQKTPAVVAAHVAYARAESLAASLQLAGADVRLVPHDKPLVLSERARATMPEIGDALLRVRDEALLALRFEGARPPAPTTLRPIVANDVEVVAGEVVQVAAVAGGGCGHDHAHAHVDVGVVGHGDGDAIRSRAPQAPNAGALVAVAVADNAHAHVGREREDQDQASLGFCATAFDLGAQRQQPHVAAPAVAPASVSPAHAALARPAPVDSAPKPKAAGPRWLSWHDADRSPSLEGVGPKADRSVPGPGPMKSLLPAASSSSHATEFGGDLDAELQLGVAMRARQEEESAHVPWAVDQGRISLGFPEAFAPLKTGPQGSRARPLSEATLQKAAAELYAPAAVAPASVLAKNQRPSSARSGHAGQLPEALNSMTGEERVDVFEDVREGLPARTVWLLGALWLSVALLLWSNNLLF